MTQEDTPGLGDMPQAVPATALARQTYDDIDVKSGWDLLQISKNFRMAVYGESGAGKTHTMFSMVEDSVEVRAGDDEWIEEVFGHDQDLMKYVLNLEIMSPNPDTPGRMDMLREAHTIIFLDWDNKGAEELFASYTMNPMLYECVNYIGVKGWEDATKAAVKGMKLVEEHLERGLGSRGLWVVIDNMEEAWSEVMSDYTRAITGMTYTELRNQKRVSHPGVTKEARSDQNTAISREMDWVEIKTNHKEWFKPLLQMDSNLMILAPPKERESETALPGGAVIINKQPSLGGEKGLIYHMNWVLSKVQTADKSSRYAKFQKTRWTGLVPRVVNDPVWSNIRKEIQRLTEDQIRMMLIKHRKKAYVDKLPVEVEKWIKPRSPKKRILFSDLPEVQLPPGYPVQSIDNSNGGLANMQELPRPVITAPPARQDIMPPPVIPGPQIPSIPPPVLPPPVMPPLSQPVLPSYSAEIVTVQQPPGRNLVPPGARFPTEVAGVSISSLTSEAVLAILRSNSGDTRIDDLSAQLGLTTDIEADALDTIIFDGLDEGTIEEVGISTIRAVQATPEIPPARQPAAAPPPMIPPPSVTPPIETGNQTEEYADYAICQMCGKTKNNVSSGTGSCYECDEQPTSKPEPEPEVLVGYVISALDNGRGSYHLSSCTKAKNMSEPVKIMTIEEAGKRKPCKICMGSKK